MIEPLKPAAEVQRPESAPRPLTWIDKGAVWSLGLGALWRDRQLVWFLAARDVRVRYKQVAFGVTWALLQPALTMLVFVIVLGRVAGLDKTTDTVPYHVHTLAALLPWQLFARGLTDSSTSLISNSNLVTKVYFPRAAIPMAPILSGCVDFAIAFGLFLVLMLTTGLTIPVTVVLVPLFLALACLLALGIGMWLSAVIALFRDVRHVLGLMVQLWMLISPIGYSTRLVPEGWRWVFGLNPMVGVIDGFRWALLGQAPPSSSAMLASALTTLVLVTTGLLFFHRVEPRFADTI